MRAEAAIRTLGIAISLAGTPACSTTWLNTPLMARADGWTITLSEVQEGPNTFPTGGTHYGPAKGESFIWTVVTVRNDLGTARTFSYDACDLDGGSDTFLPVLVDRHTILNSVIDKVEAFDAGQSRTRRLIYSYPERLRPSRMRCGPIAFPIPKAH